LTSYEDVLRAARAEQFHIRKVPVFGDADYELERAADRLLAVTTILRNLSFPEQNQLVLADEVVIKFFCSLIRFLGTHENLLKTAQNTLDIMKDIVVLLSNIAASVELPGRDQAFCLLQFILSFAPSPTPCITADHLVFSPFDPSIHKYLPYALDALAKLLARDEPNRSHYKTIVAADALSSNPYELLTRTFALAVSPIPCQSNAMRPGILPPSVDARKPLLMQGLLAADIVAQLAPGYETGVTRAWLSSGDGFAQNLLTLVRIICQHVEHPVARPGGNVRRQQHEDPDLLYIVMCAVSALRRLCEKARDPSDAASIPPNALPTRASLFENLNNLKNPRWALLLNQLSAYVGLEN
jgi:SWI/SNF chromatin-remodeling complex subunit SWI1